MSNKVVRAIAHSKRKSKLRSIDAYGPPKKQSGSRLQLYYRERVVFYPDAAVKQKERIAKLNIQLGKVVPMFGLIIKPIKNLIKYLIKKYIQF